MSPRLEPFLVLVVMACHGGGDHALDDAYPSDGSVELPIETNRLSVYSDLGCAIRDGALLCWGLGVDEGLAPPFAPTQIGTETTWARISIGGGWYFPGLRACGIRQDGSLWCWGQGLVGDGTQLPHPMPVQIGADTNWATVSAGVHHTCAIRRDATLWCWGNLAVNSPYDLNLVPRKVEGIKRWLAVAAGASTCAIATDHSLWCWNRDDTAPIHIVATANWASICAGERTSCGIQTDGSLWCWPATGPQTTAVPRRIETASTFLDVSCGATHTCATRSDGTLRCFGDNELGQLGDGTTMPSAGPVSSTTGVSVVSAGAGVTCVLSADDELRCTGAAKLSGPPSDYYATTPIQIGTGSSWLSSCAGSTQTCARSAEGTLSCAGPRYINGQTYPTKLLTQIGSDVTWSQVACGGVTCATRADTTLWCIDPYDGSIDQIASTNWSQISVGSDHQCATRSDNTLWCWGLNTAGQLGDGTTMDNATPVQVGSTQIVWASISSGARHTCATRADSTLWCWGQNVHGQLGDGTTTNRSTPVQVGTASGWARVAAGDDFTCATRTDGTLWCWGNNLSGQLGVTTTFETEVPIQVGTATSWAVPAAGGNHACATRADGTLWCWGSNAFGQLGNSIPAIQTPVQVGTATSWNSVYAGARHTCAVQADQSLWCWGRNDSGQVGNGTAWNETWHVVPLP